jgi:hypothetical protein
MILHHMCEQCGHPDYFHSPVECSYGYCKCEVERATMTTEPVHGPTWTFPEHEPVLTVTPPGTRWPEQGRGHITCACDACYVEYECLMASS